MVQATEIDKTPKQRQALDLMIKHKFPMLRGGSRSGKTFIASYAIFKRALKKSSTHLICRLRNKDAQRSLVSPSGTITKLLRLMLGDKVSDVVKYNGKDGYYSVKSADGGQSIIWIAGIEDKDRLEKILGNEFSTIYINEASEVSFDAVEILMTRLCENSGLKLRFYMDCNPPGRRHWTYSVFCKNEMPDGRKCELDTGSIQMNPVDNPHLPSEYVDSLKQMSRKRVARFYDGEWTDDTEGALWTESMIAAARKKPYPYSRAHRIVVAVDPSVAKDGTGDECGIVVCSADGQGNGCVHEDLSEHLSPRDWAERVCHAYQRHGANVVVAEGNQGGQLVADAIHNIDPYIKVEIVHASHSKEARAEPVAMLYEQEKISHDAAMPELEDELLGWVPGKSKSPNRLDALVWGFTYLLVKELEPVFFVGRSRSN